MQLGVKQLARESNMVRLLRLIECQGANGSPSDCQDLEVEKMQWMLSAMFNLDGPAYPDINNDGYVFESADPPKRILALYETPGTTNLICYANYANISQLSLHTWLQSTTTNKSTTSPLRRSLMKHFQTSTLSSRQ
jgi:hypothetical protein